MEESYAGVNSSARIGRVPEVVGCQLTPAGRTSSIFGIRVRDGEELCPNTIISVGPARKSFQEF